jgi:hypothetical protein
MAKEDNVVKLPDRLQRLAERAKKAAHACEEAEKAIFAAIIEYGTALLEGRAEFPSKERFGQWIVAEGLDQTKPFDQQQERTAAMRIAELSFQGTVPWNDCPHRRPSHIMSWWRKRDQTAPDPAKETKSYGGPKRDKAVAAILTYEAEHGELPSAVWGETAPGVTPSTYYHTLREIKSIRAGAVGPLKFTKAQDQHVEAKLKAHIKRFNAEFDERVRLAVLEENKDYRAVLDKSKREASEKFLMYEELINSYNPIFTKAEYHDILFCTHNKEVSEERKHRASLALIAKKFQLTGEK